MMANRLPAVIDSATKQNHVIQWDMDSMAGLALSAQLNWQEAMPTMSAGALQLSRQSLALGDPQRSPALLPANQPTRGDGSASPLSGKMETLLIGLELQQDGVDQWRDTAGPAKRAARIALDILSTSNLAQSQVLLEDSASAAQVILEARIERLYKDRWHLIFTLIASGFLLAYMLYAFYIGVLKSITALSRGTDAFCAGQRDVRIKLESRDELSLVATNFNTMAQEVERLVQLIEEQNQTRERDLKVLVDALGEKNEELYTVNQRVHEELNLARSVQLAILPNQFPDEPTWAAHACMHPARELGGDFYDCFALPDGRYGVLVADVSGKGVGAAFFMAVSRTVLQDSALSVRTPSQMLAIANDLLCSRNPMDLFVTACYGLFDPKDGSFEYASAGHHPPMLRRTTGSVEVLPTTNDMALGVLQGMEYQEHRTRLYSGDTLLMYTDGVTEAFSPQEIAYGEERLLSWFADSPAHCAASSLVDALVSDVARFVDGAEASDDLTCLILCNKRPSEQDLDCVV
jgi:serine phosphatase RsbU (regulator of sigma subunit)